MAFNVIKKIVGSVKKMYTKSFIEGIAQVSESRNIVTSKMMTAIDYWLKLYSGQAPWLKGEEQSLGIPAIVSSEIAKSVTLEMEVKVSGSKIGDFINKQLEPFRKNIRTNVEYACAGGGIVFKPYVCGNNIHIEIVTAGSFYPTAFSTTEGITAGYFIYRRWKDKHVYTRLEEHKLEGTDYIIINKCYKSTVDDSLGKECSLSEIADWSDISEEVHLTGVKHTLFSYFKIPIGNTIEPNSPLGVSVYARATELIKEADIQFQRLLWEYKGGELAIDASTDAFRKKKDGGFQLPERNERLFRLNNLDAASTNGEFLMKEWAPTLRDENYIRGLNKILCQIEDACCLSRGTLSEVQEIAKTATEINAMKQRTYSHVKDIQTSLEKALDNLIYSMYCIAVLYNLCPDGEYTTSYLWDDSIIVDSEAERIRDMQEVTSGLMLDWEYRVKWYGEDEATAKKRLKEKNELSDDEILNFNKEMNENEGVI